MTGDNGGAASRRGTTGVVALVGASLLWGTTGTAASFLPEDISPIAIGASTMTFGGILLFLVSSRASVAALRDTRSRRWMLVGAIGVFVYPLAFYSSMDLAGVAIGNVLALGSGPVFAALLEWGIQRHRLTRRWLVTTAIAIVGVLLLSVGGHGDSSSSDHNLPLGIALGLLAGFAYALYTYASTRALAFEHGGRGVMGGMFGVGALALAPVLLATGGPLLQSPGSVGIAAYLAIGPMFLAYLFFGFGLKYLRSSVATTITLIEPFVATILAVVVVGERLDAIGWVGLSLILLGVTVLATARQGRESSDSS